MKKITEPHAIKTMVIHVNVRALFPLDMKFNVLNGSADMLLVVPCNMYNPFLLPPLEYLSLFLTFYPSSSQDINSCPGSLQRFSACPTLLRPAFPQQLTGRLMTASHAARDQASRTRHQCKLVFRLLPQTYSADCQDSFVQSLSGGWFTIGSWLIVLSLSWSSLPLLVILSLFFLSSLFFHFRLFCS